jgi:hypothetical protein
VFCLIPSIPDEAFVFLERAGPGAAYRRRLWQGAFISIIPQPLPWTLEY